jgi:hypothetical protein
MQDDVQGMGAQRPLSPSDRKLCEREYVRGADLFKKALNQYSTSENDYQKKEFQSVMDKAMDVLNHSASDLKRQELIKQNQLIAKDYKEYKQNPDAYMKEKLTQDLETAKEKLG